MPKREAHRLEIDNAKKQSNSAEKPYPSTSEKQNDTTLTAPEIYKLLKTWKEGTLDLTGLATKMDGVVGFSDVLKDLNSMRTRGKTNEYFVRREDGSYMTIELFDSSSATVSCTSIRLQHCTSFPTGETIEQKPPLFDHQDETRQIGISNLSQPPTSAQRAEPSGIVQSVKVLDGYAVELQYTDVDYDSEEEIEFDSDIETKDIQVEISVYNDLSKFENNRKFGKGDRQDQELYGSLRGSICESELVCEREMKKVDIREGKELILEKKTNVDNISVITTIGKLLEHLRNLGANPLKMYINSGNYNIKKVEKLYSLIQGLGYDLNEATMITPYENARLIKEMWSYFHNNCKKLKVKDISRTISLRVPKKPKLQELSIERAHWITWRNIVAYKDCKIIVLEKSSFTSRDVNNWLKAWRRGNWKLEQFSVTNKEEIFSYLCYKRCKEGFRPKVEEILIDLDAEREDDNQDIYKIKRKDGTLGKLTISHKMHGILMKQIRGDWDTVIKFEVIQSS